MILCPEGQVSNELTPNRDKIETIRRILLMIWILQLIFAMSKIVVSFWLCLSEIIGGLILYLSITQLNYCNCVIYIILSAFNFLGIVAYLGDKLYNNIDIFQVNLFKTVTCYATLGLYSFSVPIVFQAYKQFKGMVYDMLLSQTNCEQEFITRESNISINGFQQPLKISDLESFSPTDITAKIDTFSSALNELNTHHDAYITEIDLNDDAI